MTVDSSVVFPLLIALLGAWEASGLMWDVKSTITGTLHSSEDLIAFGAAYYSDVKSGLEWALPDFLTFAAAIIQILADVEMSSSGLAHTLVELL